MDFLKLLVVHFLVKVLHWEYPDARLKTSLLRHLSNESKKVYKVIEYRRRRYCIQHYQRVVVENYGEYDMNEFIFDWMDSPSYPIDTTSLKDVQNRCEELRREFILQSMEDLKKTSFPKKINF